MEKGEVEDDLPDALIQRIQSFLSGKEAARSTILSKSWYAAWLTRPNLVFDTRDFWKYGYMKRSKEFSKFSKKTMQRYRDLNLNIDSFKFWLTSMVCHYSLANELTVEAIKMGATDICLQIYPTSKFVLPGDVLQSESLTRLSVRGCKMESTLNVNCSMLKYLRLCQVFLEGDLFWDVISNCPLIEGLEVRECECGVMIPLDISKKRFELHKLKTLFLEKIYICSLFFNDFSSRFPCLKDLSVHDCSDCEIFQIYSQSLEFISFEHFRVINFDVPNLRKFCYSAESYLPSVSFQNSCNWESTISISLQEDDHISAEWFINLNALLRNLSLSKVSLSLKSSYCLSNIDKAGNTTCVPRPLVEDLIIDVQSSDCATTLLDSLIQWCRPVFVNPFVDGERCIESLVIVYKRLMQQSNSVVDLEEVSIEVFDEAVSGWRTIPSVDDLDDIGVEVFDKAVSRWRAVPRSLLGTSSYRVVGKMIRFHLRWAQH